MSSSTQRGAHRRPHRLVRRAFLIGALVVSLFTGVGIAYACTLPHSQAQAPARGDGIPAIQLQSTARTPHGPFVLAGNVTGLRPGVPMLLPVTVVNNGTTPYRVLRIDVRAEGPRGCSADRNLRVTGYRSDQRGAKPVVVAPHRTAVVKLPIMLLDLPHDQNACVGAKFKLQYTGLAGQERGR